MLIITFKYRYRKQIVIGIFILFLPILDTVFAMIRRYLKGENIGEPDKEHLHHQLLKLNNSTTKTVLIMYGIDILCSVISVLYALGYNLIAIVLYLILFVFILFLIYKTDILFKHK